MRSVQCDFMSQLLEGKTALVLGVANRWSLAYAIAQAFQREGARLLLTYQGQRQKETVEELGSQLKLPARLEYMRNRLEGILPPLSR